MVVVEENIRNVVVVVEKNNRNVVMVVVVVLLCYSRSSVDDVECKGLMLHALAIETKISVLM